MVSTPTLPILVLLWLKKIPHSKKQHDEYFQYSNLNSVVFYPTDVYEIGNLIKSLDNNANPGLDEIPSCTIKFASKFIAQPVASLINLSLTSGIFPHKLKVAKVIPIYKSDDKAQFSNYRPISILNVFSKLFEKVLACRINKFLMKYDVLFSHQFGFRTGHSSYMAMTTFLNIITDELDKGNKSISIFLDLSKAFDTLDHSILLHKINKYGIRGDSWKLIASYLEGRTQTVYYNGCYSDFLPITCGVPQGSVLGPLLFLLYINDIHRCSTLLKFILFADDTTILFSAKTVHEMCLTVNRELIHVADWFMDNKLSVNIKKLTI